MAVFSHRRTEISKLVAEQLVPRFQAEHGRAPNQRELAALQQQATLRTRVNKDGHLDWDAATRGWQAKAVQQVGVGPRVALPTHDTPGTQPRCAT
jgi:hypothetical protein